MKRKSKFKNSFFAKASKDKQNPKFIIYFFLGIVLVLVCINIYKSAFFQKVDRVNIVFNDERPSYYSFGISDNVNYYVPFFADLTVTIPGGYGQYRLGALSKLQELEKNPDIIKKTFSLMTSSMVNYYFYQSVSSDKAKVYFGEKKGEFFSSGIVFNLFWKEQCTILR